MDKRWSLILLAVALCMATPVAAQRDKGTDQTATFSGGVTVALSNGVLSVNSVPRYLPVTDITLEWADSFLPDAPTHEYVDHIEDVAAFISGTMPFSGSTIPASFIMPAASVGLFWRLSEGNGLYVTLSQMEIAVVTNGQAVIGIAGEGRVSINEGTRGRTLLLETLGGSSALDMKLTREQKRGRGRKR